jgi:hypothetical protein
MAPPSGEASQLPMDQRGSLPPSGEIGFPPNSYPPEAPAAGHRCQPGAPARPVHASRSGPVFRPPLHRPPRRVVPAPGQFVSCGAGVGEGRSPCIVADPAGLPSGIRRPAPDELFSTTSRGRPSASAGPSATDSRSTVHQAYHRRQRLRHGAVARLALPLDSGPLAGDAALRTGRRTRCSSATSSVAGPRITEILSVDAPRGNHGGAGRRGHQLLDQVSST